MSESPAKLPDPDTELYPETGGYPLDESNTEERWRTMYSPVSLEATESFINDEAEDFYSTGTIPANVSGFPQGSPISPLLCSMILGSTLFNQVTGSTNRISMYADDGLVFYNGLTNPVKDTELMQEFGISFARDKCKQVKESGVWLTPLKYLGLTLDFTQENKPEGVLKASTKRGASTVFDKHQLIMDLLNNPKQNPFAAKRYEQYYSEATGMDEASIIKHTIEMIESKSSAPEEPESHVTFHSRNEDLIDTKKLYPYFKEFEENLNELGKIYHWAYPSNSLDKCPEILFYIFQFLISLTGEALINNKYYNLVLTKLFVKLSEESFQPTPKAIATVFDWSMLKDSGAFGYIQSRLYQDSWNSKVAQDFVFKFKPFSWAWYAQLIDYDPQHFLAQDHYQEIESTNLRSPGITKPEGSDFQGFNPNIIKNYGYEDLIGNFHKLSKQEFYNLLRKDPKKLTKEEATQRVNLLVRQEEFKQHPKSKKLAIIGQKEWRPHLSVFNSSSFALPMLVNLISVQGRIESWRLKLVTIGLKGQTLKSALRLIRLGHSPQRLCQRLMLDPSTRAYLNSSFNSLA